MYHKATANKETHRSVTWNVAIYHEISNVPFPFRAPSRYTYPERVTINNRAQTTSKQRSIWSKGIRSKRSSRNSSRKLINRHFAYYIRAVVSPVQTFSILVSAMLLWITERSKMWSRENSKTGFRMLIRLFFYLPSFFPLKHFSCFSFFFSPIIFFHFLLLFLILPLSKVFTVFLFIVLIKID